MWMSQYTNNICKMWFSRFYKFVTTFTQQTPWIQEDYPAFINLDCEIHNPSPSGELSKPKMYNYQLT